MEDGLVLHNDLARARKEKGLSVRDMQRFFNFEEPRAIYKWQAGQTLPTLENQFALSRLFHVSMEDIVVSSGSVIFGPRDEARGSFYCVPWKTENNKNNNKKNLYNYEENHSFQPCLRCKHQPLCATAYGNP